MSTATRNRPTPARPSGNRPRSSGPSRAASVDPFRILRRHTLLLIATALFGGGLGVVTFILLSYIYPLYSGQVVFEIRPGVQNAGDVGAQDNLRDEDVYRLAKTELVIIMARDVLTDAVDDPDVQSKTAWFRSNFIDEAGNPLVADAVDELEEDLRTSVLRGTNLFDVRWSTREQADVPIVLNAVARAYTAKREAIANVVWNQNLELFNRQLSQTNLEIQDKDAEIQDFIIDADITSLEDPRYHETATRQRSYAAQIAAAQQQLSFTTSAYIDTAEKLSGLMEPSSADILEAEQDPSVFSHIRNEEDLKFRLRAARERFREDHTGVLEIEALLRAAAAEKKAKTDEIINRNLNAKLKSYDAEKRSLESMLATLEGDNEAMGDSLAELAAQQSSYEALRDEREQLAGQRQSDRQLITEIQLMRLRADTEQVRIAEPAQTPRERSFPKPEIIVPLSTLLVLVVVVGIIFVREMTDQRIKSASDLAILTGANLLGVIPDLEEDPTKCETAELVVPRFPTSILAESYRQIGAPMTKAIDRAGHQTVVFLSGHPKTGTTTVASNLAASLGATDRTVLLVDANFRRPRVAGVLGIEDAERPGLGDLLAGTVAVDDAIIEGESGVNAITAGTPGSRIIERLNSERFDTIVAELRGRFDMIFFDAPPAVVAGDAMALANRLDAAVMVVRANQEQRGLVTRIINQLMDTNCELLGLVLNRPVGTAGGYFKKNYAAMAEYAKVEA